MERENINFHLEEFKDPDELFNALLHTIILHAILLHYQHFLLQVKLCLILMVTAVLEVCMVLPISGRRELLWR